MPAIVVGTNVVTGTTVAAPTLPIGNGATYFVTGVTERGSITAPIALTSMADYNKYCGVYYSSGFLFNDLTAFFAEGGQLAYVARVVGASSTAGSYNLLDTNASATLRLTAINPGEWSGNLTVEVVNNGVSPGPGGVPNTFSIYLRGVDQSATTILEAYLNMGSPSAAASIMAFSNYVTVTNLGSTSTAPQNNPATLNGGNPGSGVAFSTGNSQLGSLTTQSYINAASTMFAQDLGDGVCAIPGQAGNNITAVVPINAGFNRLTILSPPVGYSNTSVESFCSTLKTSVASPEHAGVFWPWVLAPNGSNAGTNTIPPDGFVAGVRARNVVNYGPWQASMGVSYGAARYITGTDPNSGIVTPALVNEVFGVGINPIRIIANVPVLYGWLTLSSNPNFQTLNGADLLDRLDFAIGQLLEPFIGAPIDARGVLYTAIAAEIQSLLDPIAQANGLYAGYDANGNQTDPGYVINVSAALNPVNNISVGTVTANVAVRESPTAQLINITVTKTALTAAA